MAVIKCDDLWHRRGIVTYSLMERCMMFQKNVGSIDRNVRIALGIVIMAVGMYFGSLWGLLGAVVFATGLLSWCGLYSLLGISTWGKDCCCNGSCGSSSLADTENH